MLSDIFGNFEIDDVDDSSLSSNRFCSADDYKAEIHSDGWYLQPNFLSSTDKDVLYFQAISMFERKQYADALLCFKRLKDCVPHNRTHLTTILDSMMQCANKLSIPASEKLSIVNECELVISEFGEQIQFWRSACAILSHVGEISSQNRLMSYICLLCATIDLPEHWLMFASVQEKGGPNFAVGYSVRALMLYERHLVMAAGFVAENLRTKITSLKKKIYSILDFDEQKVVDVRKRVGFELLTLCEKRNMDEDVKRPVYDCRSKIGVFKNAEAQTDIVRKFREKFAWMFVAM